MKQPSLVFLSLGPWQAARGSSSHWVLAWFFGAMVLSAPRIAAQPALGGSILTEQAFQARLDARARKEARLAQGAPEEDIADQTELRVGKVGFSLTPAYALEYNDNLDAVPSNTQADWIHTPQLGLIMDAPLSDRSDFSFAVGVGYRFYQTRSDLNRLFVAPGSELAWDIQVKDVWLTFYNFFSYSQEVAEEAGLSGQAEFPRFENTTGVRTLWVPGKLVLSAGYAFQFAFSDSTSFSYLDRNSHLLTLRSGYLWSPEVETGVEASGSLTDYSQAVNPDGIVASLGPYLTWRLQPELSITLRGGGAWYDNQATSSLPADSGSTWYAGLEAAQQLTDHIRHSFSVNHGLRLGVEAGSALIEQTSFNYQASWNFRDPATLDVGLVYDHGEQSLPLGGVAEETFDQFTLGLGLSYRFTQRLSARARYDLAVRQSNDPLREYTQNRGQLAVSYLLD